MPKSKLRKNHKEKVQKRRDRLEMQKKSILKLRDEHIRKIIESEKNRGLFNNTDGVVEEFNLPIEGLDLDLFND